MRHGHGSISMVCPTRLLIVSVLPVTWLAHMSTTRPTSAFSVSSIGSRCHGASSNVKRPPPFAFASALSRRRLTAHSDGLSLTGGARRFSVLCRRTLIEVELFQESLDGQRSEFIEDRVFVGVGEFGSQDQPADRDDDVFPDVKNSFCLQDLVAALSQIDIEQISLARCLPRELLFKRRGFLLSNCRTRAHRLDKIPQRIEFEAAVDLGLTLSARDRILYSPSIVTGFISEAVDGPFFCHTITPDRKSVV